MNITCLHTGSNGNCYHIETENGCEFFIEAGMSINRLMENAYLKGIEMKENTPFFITHEHLDHAEAVDELLLRGFPIFTHEGTHRKLGTENHYSSYTVKEESPIDVNDMTVIPFRVEHDAVNPLNYLFHTENESLLFLTDLNHIPFLVDNITHLMIEVNYCEEEMVYKDQLKRRVTSNHLSLRQVKEYLKLLDKSQLEAVYVLHKSDYNIKTTTIYTELSPILDGIHLEVFDNWGSV